MVYCRGHSHSARIRRNRANGRNIAATTLKRQLSEVQWAGNQSASSSGPTTRIERFRSGAISFLSPRWLRSAGSTPWGHPSQSRAPPSIDSMLVYGTGVRCSPSALRGRPKRPDVEVRAGKTGFVAGSAWCCSIEGEAVAPIGEIPGFAFEFRYCLLAARVELARSRGPYLVAVCRPVAFGGWCVVDYRAASPRGGGRVEIDYVLAPGRVRFRAGRETAATSGSRPRSPRLRSRNTETKVLGIVGADYGVLAESGATNRRNPINYMLRYRILSSWWTRRITVCRLRLPKTADSVLRTLPTTSNYRFVPPASGVNW